MHPETERKLAGLEPLPERLWLASPTMHGEELAWVTEAYETNWMSTVGANVDEVERQLAGLVGRPHAVALSSGTAALHLAVRLAGERLYGRPAAGHGSLEGHEVLCSDLTFAATVNPVAYEGGRPVFVDSEPGTWNMDPAALEKAFELHPEARLVVVAHLYGTPARWDEIRSVCDAHGALVVEDAAESLGATCRGRQTGSLGDWSVVSFNGNKIVTGSSGGALLCDDAADADRARKWSTQSRERAPWYQHEELGYNYRMSNVIAGVVRGQLPHLAEHVGRKRAIWERYRDAFEGLPVTMNPFDEGSEPNFWLSCLTVDEEAMCPQVRSGREALYVPQAGRTCPTEVLEALASLNCEGRPIWKPMHLQPIYRNHPFVTASGDGRAASDAYTALGDGAHDVGADVFARGLCLPSDIKMTGEQQGLVIECVRRCLA